MAWNFPIKKKIKCSKCGKQFEIVIRSRNTQRHTCSSCGAGFSISSREFEAVEKQAAKAAQEVLRKAFRG